MKRMDFDLFRLEDRVLFEAAAVAEIVEAAEAVQENPNANVNEAEKQAQEERDSLKNAPPENPAGQAGQNEGDAQREPAEAADIDAQVEQLIQGEIPATDGAGDVMLPELGDLSSVVLEADESGNLVDALIVPSDAMISCGRELVVINGTVPDQDAILAALKPNQEVLVLEDGNGLSELNEYLDAHDGKYDAIHLVTHGNEGYLSINGEIINAENFNAAEWADVGEHLTDDGDILLYGCDTAATAEGRLLVDHIAEASGADVAASTDATGISGDWTLEYQYGVIDNAEISVENFEHNLTNYTVTNLNDSGTGSLRWAVEQANANTGTDEITFSVNGTIFFNSSINITDNVNIIGNDTNNTIFDGQNSARFFHVSQSNIIDIRDITFQNGFVNGSAAGAVITADAFAKISIKNCDFLYNNTSDTPGCVIYVYAIDELNVDSCRFISNYGPSIEFWSTNVGIMPSPKISITNSIFSNNLARTVVDLSNINISKGQLLVNNCLFNENQSTTGGNTTCLSADNFEATIINSTFALNKGGRYYDYDDPRYVYSLSAISTNKTVYCINNIFYCNADEFTRYDISGYEVQSSIYLNNILSRYSIEQYNGHNTEYLDLSTNNYISTDSSGVLDEHYKPLSSEACEGGILLGYDAGNNLCYSSDGTHWKTLAGSDTVAVTIFSTDLAGNQRTLGNFSIGAYVAPESQSLIVTTTRDVVDSTDGYTSLREAMNYAASLNGSQTISFNITDPDYAHGSADYLVIESALPTINKSLAVKGTNVATGNDVTISVANRGCFTDGTVNESGSEFRIFTIKNGDVTLSHLNLIGGRIDQLTGNERYGAAVFGNGSSCNITIDHVNASGGAARAGGALAFTNINSVKIYDSVFEENRAAWGGAVYLETVSALISDSVFRNNNRIIDSGFSDGYYNGGALCAGANSTFSVSNSTFFNNTGSRGGALYVENSASGSAKNSLFYGNQAINSSVQNPTGVGGAIWQSQATTLETSTLSIVNCTIAENSAVNYAGGVHIKIGSITNSILWGNTASDQAQVVYDASVPITYSAIEGWSAGGSGNIALQSENSGTDIFDKHYANFVDPTRGDYHLAPTSYLMDRGNNSVVSAGEKDLDGNERIQYNMVDLGAYEKTPDETFSLIVTTGDDIVSVYDGKTSLREALTYAATLGGSPEITFDIAGNDTVILNSALDTIDFSLTIDGYNQATGNDVTISVESPGVILNTEGEWIDNPSGSAFRVFTIYTGNTVLENPITVSLHNMKLHGGYLPNYTSGVDPSLTTYGGAVYVNGKYLNFLAENVTFAQGSTYAGGGLYLRANSTLENCIFEHNRSIHGGGVHIEVSTVEVKNSFFQENNITASPYDDYRDHYYEGSYGGAISIAWDGIVAITQSRFENNQATSSLSDLKASSARKIIKA